MAPKPEPIASEVSRWIQETDAQMLEMGFEARQILLKTMEGQVMQKLALPLDDSTPAVIPARGSKGKMIALRIHSKPKRTVEVVGLL